MGLGRAFARTAAPAPEQHRNAGSTLEALIGATGGEVSGVSGHNGISTYRGGLSIPGAWRASMLIADLLGSVPWAAYAGDDDDAVKLDRQPVLLRQPAPPDTRMTTISSWALDLVWDGNAIGIIAAWGDDGEPTAVYPVPAAWVGVGRVNQRNYWLPVGSVEYSIGGKTYGPHEVIHIKGPCAPGALRGFGVLEAHLADTLALASEQRRQAHSISVHGVPTGYLKSTNPDATVDDLKAAKAGWLAAQRTRTIAALNSTTEFEPVAWDPEKLQLVEARKFTLTELALIFGLPPSFLSAPSGDSMDYKTLESEALGLLRYSMAGHLARFEQTLTLKFPPGISIRAHLDTILRPDTLTRYQAHKLGIDAGFLMRSEARRAERLRMVPGIDDRPVTAVPAEQGQDDDEIGATA
jgi:HK97 family phage portal protein